MLEWALRKAAENILDSNYYCSEWDRKKQSGQLPVFEGKRMQLKNRRAVSTYTEYLIFENCITLPFPNCPSTFEGKAVDQDVFWVTLTVCSTEMNLLCIQGWRTWLHKWGAFFCMHISVSMVSTSSLVNHYTPFRERCMYMECAKKVSGGAVSVCSVVCNGQGCIQLSKHQYFIWRKIFQLCINESALAFLESFSSRVLEKKGY